MYLQFGTYTHPIGEPSLTISRRPVLSEGGIPVSQIATWQIQGLITGDGQTDIDAKVAALIAAYRQTGVDAALLLSDGATPSQHVLRDADSIGGVRVVGGPSFPDGKGAEYATKRAFSITLEAELPVGDPAASLLSFRETLSQWGGGRRIAWTETKLGPPRPQMTRRQTLHYATQSGSAVGYRQYPAFPGYLFPPQYAVEPVRITYGGARHRGGGSFSDFAISWDVQYQSDRPLVAFPHQR
ncbi:MAG: hypothetical protein ACIALR_11440 [Blastopirellula sp. JB062]